MLGMAMVLQVGDLDQMPDTPPNFPTCGNPLYDAMAEEVQSFPGSGIQQATAYEILICLLAILSINFKHFGELLT